MRKILLLILCLIFNGISSAQFIMQRPRIISKPIIVPGIVTANLESKYSYEETNGTTIIDSQGYKNGTSYGASLLQTGKIAYCYYYDGSDDYGLFMRSLGSIDYTLCFWVKINNADGRADLFEYWDGGGGKSDGLMLGQNVQGGSTVWQLSFRGYSDSLGVISINMPTVLSVNTWYYICIAERKNGEVNIFLNGVLEGAAAYGTGWTGGDRYTTAWTGYSGQTRLRGWIDEQLLYNVQLTTAQIQQNYNATK